MLDFQIFNFVVVARIETTNVHRHTNLIKNYQTVAEILHKFFFKVADVRHFGFVWQLLVRPTTRIWWFLSLCKIWLESH